MTHEIELLTLQATHECERINLQEQAVQEIDTAKAKHRNALLSCAPEEIIETYRQILDATDRVWKSRRDNLDQEHRYQLDIAVLMDKLADA